MQTCLGIVTVRGGKGGVKSRGRGELGDTNVHMAGAHIQEYFVKNNSIFDGGCESATSCKTKTHNAISHKQYSHSGIGLQINPQDDRPLSRSQATDTKFMSGTHYAELSSTRFTSGTSVTPGQVVLPLSPSLENLLQEHKKHGYLSLEFVTH